MDFSSILGGGQPPAAKTDNSETVYISSIALLKMLKHGRAGVPMEVMGLLLGEFVDEYTVRVTDVFAMPQMGTGISVESVDDVFQTEMMEMLKQIGRTEDAVGWYHSHPGFGCWLSSVDQGTQKMFEKLHPRSIAVVVDPIQSVRGRVVLESFRLLPGGLLQKATDTRLTTGNTGLLHRQDVTALFHGLGRQFYSMPVSYQQQDFERRVLSKLGAASWGDAIGAGSEGLAEDLAKQVTDLATLSEQYRSRVSESMRGEDGPKVGRIDPKRHMSEGATVLLEQCLGEEIATASAKMAFSE
eukprot:gnl/Dysnectes_brevis/400_a442_4418.p1 GENE.gnl/Dysnectes_brevis/400_a442_4418~~gnl/Dysnectes_brevis/400_a442_4418.p1  ORF type:complete len:299 (+),score=71.60 gnl/Dysnectes_brevis/400_a442_4418:44-940(+)